MSIELTQELLKQIILTVYQIKYTDHWENQYTLF